MLPLFDERWRGLEGGYRLPFDPSEALSALEQGDDGAWETLWESLHHQGDVGLASYAAVPHLARIAATASVRNWEFYALVATIEVERHRRANPPLPDWLAADYAAALAATQALALADLPASADDETVRAILGVLALCKRQLKLGALLSALDASEIDEWADERLAWGELYA